jgi:hypothetical protein
MKLLRKIKEKYPWLPYVIGFIPFITACIGYGYYGGLSFGQTIYASLALYFVNPVYSFENGLVLFSKIAAAFVVAGIILSVIRYAYARISHFFTRFSKNATVVYTDNDLGKMVGDSVHTGYVVTSGSDKKTESIRPLKPQRVQNHILMFEDDMDNISFYTGNEKKFSNKNVYIMLRDVDPSLLDKTDKAAANLHFFNIYDLLARVYWKRNNFYDRRHETTKIAIIGFDRVGSSIFKYGFLNNIYSLDQYFEYHLWGWPEAEASFIRNFNTMNQDKIFIHEKSWDEELDALAEMNRVIYTLTENRIDLIQKVLYANPNVQIHCYSNENVSLSDIYASKNILAFGNLENVLTEENIKNEKLYKQAKLFNYDYSLGAEGKATLSFEKEAETKWKELSGFHKESSIARADHYWIEKKLIEDGELGENSETAWRIEHVRWARFHYVNHWTYGDKKDNNLRKHYCLVPYDELSYEEQKKDGINSDVLRREIEKFI